MSHVLGKLPREEHRCLSLCSFVFEMPLSSPHLDLPFAHDLVHNLVVVLVEHALVVTRLVTQDPQLLGALQLNFKLLSDDTEKGRIKTLDIAWRQGAVKDDVSVTDFVPLWLCGVPEDSGLGLAHEVSIRVHFEGAV